MTTKESQEEPAKKVQLVFLDYNNRQRRWTPKFVREGLTQERIDLFTDVIAAMEIFEKDGIPYRSGVEREECPRKNLVGTFFKTEKIEYRGEVQEE